MSHVKKALKCIHEQLILAQPNKLQSIMTGNMKMPSDCQSLTSSMPFFFLYLILNKNKKIAVMVGRAEQIRKE